MKLFTLVVYRRILLLLTLFCFALPAMAQRDRRHVDRRR